MGDQSEALLDVKRDYDKTGPGKHSLISAIFVLVHNAIGTGILLFPYAFWAFGGPMEAVLAQLVLLVFVAPSLLIMAQGAEVTQSRTYQDVVSHLCGPIIGKLCHFLLAVTPFGGCTAVLILIGDQLIDMSSAFTLHNGKHLSEEWYFDRRISTPLLSIVFILPLLMLKNIGSLSYTSLIGFASSLYVTAVVVVKYVLIDDDYLNCKGGSKEDCHTSWTSGTISFSIICTAYMCHATSVPVYFGLKRRSVKRYSVVVITVMSSCLIVYSVTGLFGYLTFNSRTCISGDVLRNYCPRDIPISIARIMIVVSLITLYPILCYIGRSALDTFLLELGGHKWMTFKSHDTARAQLEAVAWFSLSVLLASFIPDILVVVGPFGGVTAIFMITFPGLCLLNLLLSNLLQITSQLLRLLLYVVAISYIAFSCYILGSSVTYSIMSEAHLIS